jgi:hypothetical protein
MYKFINKELNKRINERALRTLQDTLDGAQSYFGVSIIPLEEWFEPSMQVYLAKILNRKLEPDDFEHERTLLFFSKGEYKKATNQFMEDYYYGECLAHLHKDCSIPLSFLKREDIFKILSQLTESEKEALGCYPRWTNWRPCRGLRRLPLKLLRRRITQLDLAFVEKKGGETFVLCISKRGGSVDIHDTRTDSDAVPYKRLHELIKKQIYDPQTKRLRPKHDFGANY